MKKCPKTKAQMRREVKMRRRPDCRHYDACLDVAAKSDFSFGCDRCKAYRSTPIFVDSQEHNALLALLAAVFGKKTNLQRIRTLFFTRRGAARQDGPFARSERSAMSQRESNAA